MPYPDDMNWKAFDQTWGDSEKAEANPQGCRECGDDLPLTKRSMCKECDDNYDYCAGNKHAYDMAREVERKMEVQNIKMAICLGIIL